MTTVIPEITITADYDLSYVGFPGSYSFLSDVPLNSPSYLGPLAQVIHSTMSSTLFSATTLTPKQWAVASAITDYGLANGFTTDQVKVAIDQAFYESGFNQTASNVGHYGLFEYDLSTWSVSHSAQDIMNSNDQITAIYQDINVSATKYFIGEYNGSIPSNLSFEDYFEIKHHAGSNSTDWTSSYLPGYHLSTATLGIGILVLPTYPH